jgi:SAM-dependent methyltransferase
MPIIKCKNYVDVYRSKASASDTNELSGRSGRPDLTHFVSQQILNKMNIGNSDVVIDIGCGDGTLLKQAARLMRYGVGVLPTDEEVDRVRSEMEECLKNIDIVKGTIQSTSLPSGLGTKIVCNGVILLLDENEVEQALKEIVRISRHTALVYIGEVPSKNEFENRRYGDSIIKWLIWVLRNQGMRAFIARLLQVGRSLATKEPFVIAPKTHFYAYPEAFIKVAEKCGLTCQESYPHKAVTESGEVIENDIRYDFLFVPAGRSHPESHTPI